MQPEVEKLKLYIYIKWGVIVAIALQVGVITRLGMGSLIAAGAAFTVLSIAAFTNLWLSSAIKREKHSTFIAHSSLSFDLLLIVVGLYFNGGIESAWYFIPAIVIFIVGYLFTLRAILIYALFSFFSLLGMFLLEYFKIIPHFSIYGLSEPYWKNPEYYVDYLSGVFLFYFATAFASGYFNQIIRKTSTRLEKSLSEAKAAQKESENSRRAMQKVMEDLARAKEDLEGRVRERTKELQERVSELERYHDATVDRELRMKELRNRIEELEQKLKELRPESGEWGKPK